MSEIERSDLSEDAWRFTGNEHASSDDPIIHGPRWRRERDEARRQLRGAVDALREIASDECMLVRTDDGPFIDMGRPQKIAKAALSHLGGQ